MEPRVTTSFDRVVDGRDPGDSKKEMRKRMANTSIPSANFEVDAQVGSRWSTVYRPRAPTVQTLKNATTPREGSTRSRVRRARTNKKIMSKVVKSPTELATMRCR